MEENDELIFFTDGAFSHSKNKGGWAFYCPEYRLRVCHGEESTTSNRMEVTAAIKVLEWLSDSKVPEKKITIYSDSLYLVNTVKGSFTRNANLDLWNQLDLMIELLFDKQITWVHIKGHNGTRGNEIVDKLANLVSQI
jgi:ribonuclease HI